MGDVDEIEAIYRATPLPSSGSYEHYIQREMAYDLIKKEIEYMYRIAKKYNYKVGRDDTGK